ncbi:MAG: hypothetical protein QXQ77_03015 [Candidatus Aenigmatarchaeota archaeon]
MSWDGNLYVDESVKTLIFLLCLSCKFNLIGAGVGIKTDNVELLDWRGIAYYQPNGNNKCKNGNGYWSLLGKETLELILNKSHDYKPEKVYVCNQIAFYVMKAAISFKTPTKEIKSLVKRMVPVTHRDYRGYNGIYKTKSWKIS